MKNTNKKITAFTLIELLVVIVIIGILAGIGVSQFKSYRLKAEITDATVEMNLIEKAIILARINTQGTLTEITGNGCSECVCRNGNDLRNIDESHPCLATWISNIAKISDASGIQEINFYRDAWGSPYVFDENEGERSSNYCVQDSLISPGPDGIYLDSGAGGQIDNITIKIPFYDTKKCGQ